jgi:hypothetical protein
MFGFKRKILIVVLALGAVAGFTSGFMSLGRCANAGHRGWRAEVTDICSDAVRQAQQQK